MTDIVTGNQIDIAAFDSGVSNNDKKKQLRGTQFADWVEDRGRDAVRGIHAASQDQEGWHDDALRFGGKLLQGAGAVAEAPVIKQGLQVLDAPFHYGSKLAGAAAERMGIDPRLGEWTVRAGELATGVGALKKAPKVAGKVGGRLAQEATEFAFRNAPEGSIARMVADTGGGVAPLTKKTKEYQKWLDKGKQYYYKNITKDRPMKGYEKFFDELSDDTYSLSTTKKTGRIIDGVVERDLGPVSKSVRDKRNLKRDVTTKIPVEEVENLAKKYHQPPEIVDAFMKDQKARKKVIDDAIAKINKRIKANPERYSKDFKASLGHGRAAERYLHSADIASNLDIENFLLNISRSNKDEISDYFNRALGRSLDLEEEFLKFVDPDLREFHKKFNLGRGQKTQIIDSVNRKMKTPVNWKAPKTKGGKQLYKSKEEFLINEALEQLSATHIPPARRVN